ncbi:uncharacterized protein LOC141612414 [Silene latifolia]|uniref:uncharacterized protein LOC141612414 n=1 Tax=Silene latifolia TaxID=37657 RepID=UPI003D76F796
MADIKEAENAAFWLPPHFLTEEKPSNDPKMNPKSYDLFDSGFWSDPFESPDYDENINQNDDALLLSHLTRHFSHTSLHNNKSTTPEKPRLYSTSPQSTLSGFGSGNGRSGYSSNGSPTGPSPPLTPNLKNDAAWDLLYEAAGEVARLKINAMAAQMNNNRGLLGAPRHTSCFEPSRHHHLNAYNNQELKWTQKSNNCECGYLQPRRSSGVAWIQSQPNHHRNQHRPTVVANSMYQGRSGMVGPTMEGVKPRSTGTGVFLPRRISTSPPPRPRNYQQQPQPQRSVLRVKPTVAIPDRYEEANQNFQSRLTAAKFPTDHEIMWARRNVILGQQRKTETKTTATMVGQGQELSLPNDWTY